MFNSEFYPTTKQLINRMVSKLDLNYVSSILEPSAGKGDIVDYFKEREGSKYSYRNYTFDIDCIELDKNLQSILKGKDYRVVHDDFLTYETMKEYDLIIMNPPFSNGVKHVLKAIRMQERNGGSVIALLNAETLKNDFSNDRKELNRLIDLNKGSIEYIQDAFLEAERKTSVEVALIKVQLPKVKKTSFIFDELKKAQEVKEIEYSEDNQLIENDFFKSIIDQYNLEINAGIKLIKEFEAMKPFILNQFSKDEETGETIQKGDSILSLDLTSNRNAYTNKLSINSYLQEVRGKYWSALFNNQKFIGKLTDNLRREFYNKLEELKNYDFTMYNINTLRLEMTQKTVKGIEETILNLFEEFSHKHYWDKTASSNIHYYNGWKTNKSWIVNSKVIIPLNAYDSTWGRYQPSYKAYSKLSDMEKVFNYLDGGLTEAIDLEQTLKFAEEYGETSKIECKYFRVTFYKKGTCHIEFTNLELLKKFNIFGSQQKGWLPPSYGKTTYKDMTPEEKTVVNEFEGEKEYNKVLVNSNYYIYNSNNLMLLEEKSA